MGKDRTPDEAESPDEEPEPMNRAERRAKAKGKKLGQANAVSKQGFSPKGGQAHTHRMWSNRRAG
ncbi:MAG TPA: hypothetical protein VFC19_23915 [Candidatus Limnocylindrales bacterium]|nr:hypothetical protein [Candidatus Limnocylindrales bacterium]